MLASTAIHLLAFRPAQPDEEIRSAPRAMSSEPLVPGQLCIQAFEVSTQLLTGQVLYSRMLGFVGDESLRSEQRLARRVHVGIEVTQPAIHFRALARRAIAVEFRFRKAFHQVIEDGDVLGERPTIFNNEGRYLSGRIELE